MRRSLTLFLLITLFGGFAQLSAQEYDEHDKEQLRRFLRQEKNFEVAGLTESDTMTWLSSESWINKTYISGIASWSKVGTGKYYISDMQLYNRYNISDYKGKLNIDACQYLTKTTIMAATLESVTISNCDKLSIYSLSNYSTVKYVDISNCTSLKTVFFGSNALMNFNVDNIPNVTTFTILNNPFLTSIDLSKFPNLENLTLSNTSISEFDLFKTPSLKQLDIAYSNIKTIDLSENKKLGIIRLANNQLKEIILPENSSIYELRCENNHLTFKTLDLLKKKLAANGYFSYSPQGKIPIEKSQKVGEVIDLGDFSTNNYEWYFETEKPLTEGVHYVRTENGPIFKRTLEDSIYCQLTNHNFPDLTLTTTKTTTFIEGHVYREKEKEKIRTFLRNGDNISVVGLSLNDSTTWYESEDWLNKVEGIKWTKSAPHYISEIQWNNQDWSFSGEFNFNRCDSLISINVEGCKIDSINILNCPNLKSLSFSNNDLQKAELYNLATLKNLKISNNKLSTISLHSIVGKVENIDLSSNQLKNMFISYDNANAIKSLNISKNKFSFSYLKSITDYAGVDISKIIYAPQQIFKIESRYPCGSIDIKEFTPECNLKWSFKDGTPVDPSHYEIGWNMPRFKTELKDSIYCQITHPNFPDLTLTSTNTVIRVMSFDESIKDVFRKFLRQGNNMEILGITPVDTLNWHDLGDWMNHIKGTSYYLYGTTYSAGLVVDWTNLKGKLEGDLDFETYQYVGSFNAKNHNFKSLNFSNNTIVTIIDVQNCGLEEINVENCARLSELNLNNNKLSKIKSEKNSALVRAYLNNNNLEDADFIKGFTSVAILEINNNSIPDADMSMNKSIQQLRMTNNKLTSIDLSNSTIYNLDLSNNKLSALDLSRYTYLYEVKVANNQLKEIKYSPSFINPYMISSWENNNLTFTSLPPKKRIPTDNKTIFTYSPQNQVEIDNEISESIDLKHTGGENFAWFTTENIPLAEGEDYTVENGISTFTKKIGNEIYCLITNQNYPLLTLQTTKTKITNEGQSIESSTLEDAVKAYSDKAGELILVAPIEAKYVVYNLSGDVVAQGTVTETEETVSAPSGIYIVRIGTNEGTVNRKVIVK